jgi:alpha-D-xyloside xylohydrolase
MIDLLHKGEFPPDDFHLGRAWAAFADLQGHGQARVSVPTVGWAGFKYFDVYNPAATIVLEVREHEGLFSKGVDAWWMDSTEPDIVNALTKESEEYEMKRVEDNHLGSFARYLNTYSLLEHRRRL